MTVTNAELHDEWQKFIEGEHSRWEKEGIFSGPETYHRACFNAGYLAAAAKYEKAVQVALNKYDAEHVGPPGRARRLIEDIAR